MGWNINPRNDKNRNDVPDDIDRAIISFVVWEICKAILLILAVYTILRVFGKL